LNFYGTGGDSELENRTAYTLRDPVVGVVSFVDVTPVVSVGGRVEETWPIVQTGQSSRAPSIELRFSDGEAPGILRQPRFGRYQAFVEVTVPAADGFGLNQGGAYRISYDVFDDQQLDRFDFDRWQVEGRHRFATFLPYHSLTLRGWVSSAEPRPGSVVPFFMQHTLGGTSNIRSVHDEPLGGDSTDGTLRGFANHRYRDNHLLLFQGEYRWNPWGLIETTLFVDAGKVASRLSDLSLSGLQTDYGFSVSLMRAARTVVRADFAFGDEGGRLYIEVRGLP
jgi:hypothetical protein